MKLDYSITVEGLNVRPLSCYITFGINQIPVAQVGIDPTVGDVLQNAEAYKRTKCTIIVDTVRGGFEFPCLFDGISYSMSPGGIGYTAVFKSQFQTFLEIFPFTPGFHPAGVNPYIRDSLLTVVTGDSTDETNQAALNSAIGMSINEGDNLAQSFINGITAMVRNQAQLLAPRVNSTTGTANILIPNALPKLASVDNPAYKKALDTANELSALIDTSAVSDFTLDAAHINELNFLSNILLTNSAGSLWELLLQGLSDLGLVAVPGPTKLYVVPEAYFMKPSYERVVPGFQQAVDKPNFASPGYYNSISFSDNGYQDIGAVIISANAYMSNDISGYRSFVPFPVWNASSDIPLSFGCYPSEDAISTSNINGAIINVPASWMANLYCSYFYADREGMTNITEDSSFEDEITGENISESSDEAIAAREAIRDEVRTILDNLAEMEFLKRKYMDRTGSINLLFSPNWVPGTTGTAYTRYPEPGIFTDFYVQQVTHCFDNTNGSGTATTSVSFCSGRIGEEPAGVDTYKLYRYTTSKMGEFQEKYVKEFNA